MANGTTGILTADATPEVARRTWPRWAGLGVALLVFAVAVALLAGVRVDAGPRVLLCATGGLLIGRGTVLITGARAVGAQPAGRARGRGAACLLAGAATVGVGTVAAGLARWVVLVAVPVLLLGAALGLIARGGLARRGGQALLVWAVLVVGLLVLTGLGQGWARAASAASVAGALGIAVLAVLLLVGAARLRTAAARPDPEPGRPLGCAGCACAGGGCATA